MNEIFNPKESKDLREMYVRALTNAGLHIHPGAHINRDTAVHILLNDLARYVSLVEGLDDRIAIRNTTLRYVMAQIKLGENASVLISSEWRQIQRKALDLLCANKYPEYALPKEYAWRAFEASIANGRPELWLFKKGKTDPICVFKGKTQPASSDEQPAPQPAPTEEQPAPEPEPTPAPATEESSAPPTAQQFHVERPANEYLPAIPNGKYAPVYTKAGWLKKLPKDNTYMGVMARAVKEMLATMASEEYSSPVAPISVMVSGEAGLGKSYLVRKVAHEVGAVFGSVSCVGRGSGITGLEKPVTERYLPSELILMRKSACENPTVPHIFLIDELDTMPPEAQNELYTLFEDSTLTSIYTGKISFPPNMMFVLTSNTAGNGATETYTGRYPVDHAVLSRMTVSYVVDFEIDVALAIIGENDDNRTLVEFMSAWNEVCDRKKLLRLRASYRTLRDYQRCVKMGFSVQTALGMKLLANHRKRDINTVWSIVDTDVPSSWVKTAVKAAIAKVRD